jgi:hypothetical protein
MLPPTSTARLITHAIAILVILREMALHKQ